MGSGGRDLFSGSNRPAAAIARLLSAIASAIYRCKISSFFCLTSSKYDVLWTSEREGFDSWALVYAGGKFTRELAGGSSMSTGRRVRLWAL